MTELKENQRTGIGPALQFEVDPYADLQERSIREITEGATFSGGGPGSAGAGCGCH